MRNVVATQVAPSSVRLDNLTLVDDVLEHRLVQRIMKDEDLTFDLASRILDQAVGYLKLAALRPDMHYSPSPLVDIGWHTFILYTREYGKFCRELTGGQFIHHEPTDNPGTAGESLGPYQTAAAMRELGITVDEPLWACLCKADHSSGSGDCSNCNGGQGCQCGPCNY